MGDLIRNLEDDVEIYNYNDEEENRNFLDFISDIIPPARLKMEKIEVEEKILFKNQEEEKINLKNNHHPQTKTFSQPKFEEKVNQGEEKMNFKNDLQTKEKNNEPKLKTFSQPEQVNLQNEQKNTCDLKNQISDAQIKNFEISIEKMSSEEHESFE